MPNVKDPEGPPDPSDRWPVSPTGVPLPPRAQPGYYPGYSTLSQQAFWDEATRKLILDRVGRVPPVRFFSPGQAQLLAAVCDRVLPQDDRDQAHRIPVLHYIDERLHENRGDGYRFEGMPPDREAHLLGLQGIEAIAQHLHGRPFQELGPGQQDQVLLTLHDGKPPSGHPIWEKLPVHRYWFLLVGDVAAAYYAHPFAWDEIGFGGPAYPRGYMRLENGQAEPWEVDEQRYPWQDPPGALSGAFEPVGGSFEHHGTSGQGGTH